MMEERLSEIDGKLLPLLGVECVYETTPSNMVNKNPIMAAGSTRNDAAAQHPSSSSSLQVFKFHISRE